TNTIVTLFTASPLLRLWRMDLDVAAAQQPLPESRLTAGAARDPEPVLRSGLAVVGDADGERAAAVVTIGPLEGHGPLRLAWRRREELEVGDLRDLAVDMHLRVGLVIHVVQVALCRARRRLSAVRLAGGPDQAVAHRDECEDSRPTL